MYNVDTHPPSCKHECLTYPACKRTVNIRYIDFTIDNMVVSSSFGYTVFDSSDDVKCPFPYRHSLYPRVTLHLALETQWIAGTPGEWDSVITPVPRWG